MIYFSVLHVFMRVTSWYVTKIKKQLLLSSANIKQDRLREAPGEPRSPGVLWALSYRGPGARWEAVFLGHGE